MKHFMLLFLCLQLLGCKSVDLKTSDNLKLKYLDEYILSNDLYFAGTPVGGLSGIDFHNGLYYLVCDDASNPRFYETKIDIKNKEITNITIQKVIQLKDTSRYLDLESIRYNPAKRQFLLTSEGHIYRKQDPSFLSADSTGKIENYFEIPKSFLANSIQKPRHNGTLEGLSLSVDGVGFWIGMELPLEADGPEPKIEKTNSPVRITYIDGVTKIPAKQFALQLDPIAKVPKDNFAVNGLTDLLEYETDKFFVIERSYSSGLGNQGNTIKIFKVSASEATNTLGIERLNNADYRTATKELLFDFEEVRDQLTNESIDNIEGISFGPILPNGNKTMLLVADNNFNKLGEQLNQFILLEIID